MQRCQTHRKQITNAFEGRAGRPSKAALQNFLLPPTVQKKAKHKTRASDVENLN